MGELPLQEDIAAPQHFNAYPSLKNITRTDGAVNGEEEDYTIKCICGFQDDDGHTALCEQCNTWQHVDCYYYPENNVPDIHKCADCFPRLLPEGATERQRLKREAQNANEERKAKRSAQKGNKKPRYKDSVSSNGFQANGWSPNDEQYDHTSGNPHDQLPLFKRTKTHHRNSQSTSSIIYQSSQRGRNFSNTASERLLSRPPLDQCPPTYLSADFIRAHQADAQFHLIGADDSNEWSHLDMATEFSSWLDDPDAFDAVSNGKKQNEVFQRAQSMRGWDWPVEKRVHTATTVWFHARHPIWPHLVANKPVDQGRFLGELIGTIGHRDEYMQDPQNQWERLRHPDIFVFFHPVLPIYLDCRRRGSLMRYVRRSCRPNIKMETIVTGERDFHFCFTATRHVAEGEELTVAWNTQFDRGLNEALAVMAQGQYSGQLGQQQRDYVTDWAGTLLAHFGGCACETSQSLPCLLAKFDNRLPSNAQARIYQNPGDSSPRYTSENTVAGLGCATLLPLERIHDVDDHRSSTRSSQSRSSRDPTPNSTDYSVHINGVDSTSSERDRKKLLQTTRLIEKLDHHKHHRKKRQGGTQAHTPVLSNLKQQVHSDTLGPKRKKGSADTASYFAFRVDMPPVAQPSSASSSDQESPSVASATPSRFMYVDVGVQTNLTRPTSSAVSSLRSRQPRYTPLSQRMLRRLHLSRTRRKQLQETLTIKNSVVISLPPVDVIGVSGSPVQLDVFMGAGTDDYFTPLLPQSSPVSPPVPMDSRVEAASETRIPTQSMKKPTKPAAPAPKSSGPNKDLDTDSIATAIGPSGNHDRKDFHVDLPHLLFSSTLPSSDHTMQSPTAAKMTGDFAAPIAPMVAPFLTPSGFALAQSSPIKRKKISFQDYSQRSKARMPGAETGQRTGQHGSSAFSSLDGQHEGSINDKVGQESSSSRASNGTG